jgi:DNA-binding transcriptional regulator YiaG
MTPLELSQRRLALGLKQAELAWLLGMHAITVSKWERGVVPVPTWLHYALWAIEHNAPHAD